MAHVVGQFGGEHHLFARSRMDEAQLLGVEGMSGHQLEAVVDELAVFGERGAFQDLVAAVGGIVEEGMADVLRVDTDLVGASCLQTVFVKRSESVV